MSYLPEIRRKNLQSLVDQYGLAEVARAVKKPASQINDMLAGRKSFGEKVARAMEDEWSSALHIGYFDTPQLVTGHASIAPEKGNVLVWESPDDLPGDDKRVWVDRYDYSFSAGDGRVQWEVREKKALPFDRGFFEKLGSRPKDCKLCVARGDSMEPYLFNRDMVMVDTAKKVIRDGRVYAVIFEGEALVKQIFKTVGGGIVLHSYNASRYPDKEIPPEKMELVQIAGEVIYRSGSGIAGGN